MSSTCGLAAGHHLFRHVNRDRFHCHGLATHGFATMRVFDLSWVVVVGSLVMVVVLWCLFCELPTASLADQALVYFGYPCDALVPTG